MGPFIGSNINTGVGLYAYLPNFAFLVVLLIPILFVTVVLASQRRPWLTNFILAFASSCLFIGIIDGGMFATPSYFGIFGLYLVYRNGYYINEFVGEKLNDTNLLKTNELNPPIFKIKRASLRKYFNHTLVVIAVIAVILLRFTIAFAGAEPDYYTVDVVNPSEEIDLGNISAKIINYENNTNKITYHIDPQYNEIQLINDLKVRLNNSCEYYTVSWNIYSY